LSPIDLDELAAFAGSLADLTHPVVERWFRADPDVENKADGSPVTIADKTIERLLRDAISARYPDHGILGEEYGRQGLDHELVWVIDPIDGTKSFITGIPLFGTLIALLEKGKPVLGLVEVQRTGERWLGLSGRPTTLNGKPVRAARTKSLADAIVLATSPDIFNADDLAAFDRVSRAARIRRFGGDCYAWAMVATGTVDAVVEAGLQPYDYLALIPVIEGAGGIVTDWEGAPVGITDDARVVAAATPELHAEILARLRA